MISAATEDTISAILKEELETLGVETKLLHGIHTPAGFRKPDLLCSNSGIYPIEAKFKESDLIGAIAKIRNDYIKHHKILGVKGGFAVLYPQELTKKVTFFDLRGLALKSKFKLVAIFPDDDPRPFKVYEGILPEITEIIAEHILSPPVEMEPSTDYIIKSLRDSTISLIEGLAHLTGNQLEGFFGGKNVFENILQYGKDEYPIEDLRYAAAYLLTNQLLFYHVLSKRKPEFPEIDSDNIRRPSDLKKYFQKVLDINYRIVFSYDITSLIPQVFVAQIKIIINVISALGPHKVGGDLLGTIFHDLIPFEIRKKVAAFYTNVFAAELLASLSIDREDAQVADLAVGSGGLLVAAYRRKRALLKRPLDQEDHRRFVEDELLGIDVMPFAANVAACQLALQAPQYFTDKVNLAVWDSTDLKPGMTIPSVAERDLRFTGQTFISSFDEQNGEDKGGVNLTGKGIEVTLETYDLLIMNPPFTRQERIPKEYKTLLSQRFSWNDQKEEYNRYLHGQLGYHGYFILLADRFLKENGRMALVLPASVLRLKSFEGLRRLWSERYHVEHIITQLRRSAFSESTLLREILFVARKSKSKEGEKTAITVLKRLPDDLSEARNMAERISSSEVSWENDVMMVKFQEYSKLRENTDNWFKYISVSDLNLIDIFDELKISKKLAPLSSIKNIIRGYELRGGDVTRLIINRREDSTLRSIDIWILSDLKKRFLRFNHRVAPSVNFKVPIKYVRKTIRRASGLNKMDITKELDHIIVEKWNDEEFSKLEDAAGSNLSDAQLTSIKNEIEKRLGNIFIVRRMDISAPQTNALAFYSAISAAPTKMMWSLKVPDEDAKIIVTYLNSSFNILQALLFRAETRGAFIGLDKYILNDFRLIDTSKLSSKERDLLLSLFEKVSGVELPSILEQLKKKNPYRQAIDRAYLQILGYEGDVDKLIDGLYESLAAEIEILKTIMAERD